MLQSSNKDPAENYGKTKPKKIIREKRANRICSLNESNQKCHIFLNKKLKNFYLKWLGNSLSFEQALMHGNTVRRTLMTHFRESSPYNEETGMATLLVAAWP